MKIKDIKIIADAEKEGIPIFIFVAKDKLARGILQSYFEVCMDMCDDEKFHISLIDRLEEWDKWIKENPDKIKIPD